MLLAPTPLGSCLGLVSLAKGVSHPLGGTPTFCAFAVVGLLVGGGGWFGVERERDQKDCSGIDRAETIAEWSESELQRRGSTCSRLSLGVSLGPRLSCLVQITKGGICFEDPSSSPGALQSIPHPSGRLKPLVP